MKTLFALLLLAGALAAGYWKTQHPEATVDDLKAHGLALTDRLKGGLTAIRDGGGPSEREQELQATMAGNQEAVNARLESVEGQLENALSKAEIGVVNGRLTDSERRMDATQNQLDKLAESLDGLSGSVSENSNQLDDIKATGSSLTDSLSSLQSRVSDFDGTLSSLQSSLGGVQSSLGGLDSGTADVSARVDALGSTLGSLTERLDQDTTAEDIAALTQKMADIDAQLGSLREAELNLGNEVSTGIAAIEEKSAQLEARFNTLSTEALSGDADSAAAINAQIDQRLALIEQKLDTTNTDSRRLTAVTEQLTAARARIEELEAQLATTSTSVTSLGNSMDSLGTSVESLGSSVDTLGSSVNTLGSDVDNLRTSVNSDIESLRTRTESVNIDALQDELRIQLASLQNDLESSESNTGVDVAGLTAALEASRERIKTLEQRVTELPEASSEADAAQQMQQALETQVAQLETRLGNLPREADPALVNTITEVKEQVDQLASKSFVTQEELNERAAALLREQQRQQQEARTVEYKIYFDRNSTAVTEDAARVLNSFIAQEKNRALGVSIFGFTDRRGSASYNQQLALQRATNVRSYLIQNGFDYTRINSITGLGEDAAAAELEDETEDAQQRVVVLFAQQP